MRSTAGPTRTGPSSRRGRPRYNVARRPLRGKPTRVSVEVGLAVTGLKVDVTPEGSGRGDGSAGPGVVGVALGVHREPGCSGRDAPVVSQARAVSVHGPGGRSRWVVHCRHTHGPRSTPRSARTQPLPGWALTSTPAIPGPAIGEGVPADAPPGPHPPATGAPLGRDADDRRFGSYDRTRPCPTTTDRPL